ncbi:TonB-dependent receptor plug domain-containing protein [Phenylobacterium sp.]|uniref:TonB-dependent receptor plug domain-containing protein n=1 Tax=Phenylobacterium sp. TaxID=1871053 RepID=UPI00391D34FF
MITARQKRSATAFVGLLLAGAAAPALAMAEDAAGPAGAKAVDEVIVTGHRAQVSSVRAAEAIEYGNAVQVVTTQQIEDGGFVNIAEAAVALVRGANIGYSPDEGEYTIRLDGGGDRDTLVVLDGVPLYDRGPALEEIWGTTTIDPHMIERMEVFRGGNSLFYGSSAGIGVVSLVTKRPDGTRKGEFGVSYGSFNSRELWANFSMPIDADGRHSVMLYGSSQQTDGPRIFRPEDFVDNVAAAGGVQKYPLNRNNIGVKYLWKIDEASEFRLNAQYTQIEFQDAFPDNNVFTPNRVEFPIIDASYIRDWSPNLHTEVEAYWTNPQLSNTELFAEICRIPTGCVDPSDAKKVIPWGVFTGAVEPYQNQGFGEGNKYASGYEELGLTVRNTIKFHKYFELVAGVQSVTYRDDSASVFLISDDRATTTGVYFDARPRLPFSPDTAISLAVRTDFAEAFDQRTTWKFGVRQPLPGGFYVRANGGTSYSLPRTNELYREELTIVGNPDLKTEETETYNAGIGFDRPFMGGRVRAEVGGFMTDITDRIRTTSGLTPNTYYNDPNVTEIRGLTADLDWQINSEWSASLSYTKQEATPAGSSVQINETPEYFLQGGLNYNSESGRFHFSLLPRYQGPEYATGGPGNVLRHNFGEYLVVNATAGYWFGEDNQYRLQFRVVNLLDEKYAERYGYGNMRFSKDFITGKIKTTDLAYYYGYPFEGKPRAYYVTFSTKF